MRRHRHHGRVAGSAGSTEILLRMFTVNHLRVRTPKCIFRTSQVQNVTLPLRPTTVSVAKLALPGSITCKSAVRMNQGVMAKL
jgi:hypothetical protein